MMESRHIAVFGSIAVWAIAVLVFLVISYRLISGKTSNIKKGLASIIVASLITAIAVPVLFNHAGNSDLGSITKWGCYLEDFFLLCILMWIVGGIVLFILFIIGITSPKTFRIPNVLNVVFLFFTNLFYPLIMLVLINFTLTLLASNLNGFGCSCY